MFSRLMRRLFLGFARSNLSPEIGSMWLFAATRLTASPGPLVRRFTDEIQPPEPLGLSGSLPALEIVIPCSRKDLDVVPATVSLGLDHVVNPVRSVTLVPPENFVAETRNLGLRGDVVGEDALLPRLLKEVAGQHHPVGRYGWVLQQLIGLYFAWSSGAAGVLVLDSDTLLTRSRVFLLQNRRQLLSFSHEYFEPYEDHAAEVWGPRRRHRGLSYVTHYQLMQPWILRKMFPKLEDLVSWVQKSRTDHKSPLADYHSYGRWLCDNHPELVSLGRWANKSVARQSFASLDPELLGREVRLRYPRYFSVSLHSYLR